MKLFQKFIASIALAVAIAPNAAIGQTASYTSPHKFVDSATSKTYVYIPGQTAGSAVTGFSSPKSAKPKTLTLNNCGWGSFTKSATSPPTLITGIGGAKVNWAGKSTGAAVTCAAPVAPATTYTSSNDEAVGSVVDDGAKIWIRGGTAAGAISIEVVSLGTITSKANACGFVRVTTSATRPMTAFSIGATNYTLDALPSVTKPMICRKVGTNSFTYVPAN